MYCNHVITIISIHHDDIFKKTHFFHQDELYVVQEEEKLQSIAQYDLGLRPKLRKSDKIKSVSMPTVESAGSSIAIQVKAFDSPKVPIKKKSLNVQISAATRIEDIAESNKLQKLDVRNTGRKKVCWQTEMLAGKIRPLINHITFLAICARPARFISSSSSGSLFPEN